MIEPWIGAEGGSVMKEKENGRKRGAVRWMNQ